MLAPVPDEVACEMQPVLLPVIRQQRDLARTRELWERWCTAPERVGALWPVRRRAGEPSMAREQDSDAFQELSSACPLDEYVEDLYVAFDRIPREWQRLVLAPGCRKGYPAAALAHGLGPQRFAVLPGWFGDMVLTAQQVQDALPDVTAAFDMDPEQRRMVEARTVEWLCDSCNGDAAEAGTMLDGIVPLWRAAVDAQAGILGCMLVPS